MTPSYIFSKHPPDEILPIIMHIEIDQYLKVIFFNYNFYNGPSPKLHFKFLTHMLKFFQKSHKICKEEQTLNHRIDDWCDQRNYDLRMEFLEPLGKMDSVMRENWFKVKDHINKAIRDEFEK